jgi:hypothetical protein
MKGGSIRDFSRFTIGIALFARVAMAQTIHLKTPVELTAHSNVTDSERGWPRLSTSEPFAGDSLLPHFLDTLLVRARLLKNLVEPASAEDRVLEEVRNEIANFNARCNLPLQDRKRSAWAEAYRIELLLLLAEPGSRLSQELEYRLSYAEDIGVRGTTNMRTMFQQATTGKLLKDGGTSGLDNNEECDLRFLLIETVRKTQWHLIKKYLSRCYLRSVMKQIVCATLLSFAFCVSMYMVSVSDYQIISSTADKVQVAPNATPGVPKDNTNVSPIDNNTGQVSPNEAYIPTRMWGIAVPLLVCLSAGLFGSYFSRLLDIEKNSASFSYDELLATKNIWAMLVRGAIGVCGAAVLYFFLRSGIVTAPLIPDINHLIVHDTKIMIPNRELALLTVWGFIGGFSERLVPSILSTTESRLEGKSNKIGHTLKRPPR